MGDLECRDRDAVETIGPSLFESSARGFHRESGRSTSAHSQLHRCRVELHAHSGIPPDRAYGKPYSSWKPGSVFHRHHCHSQRHDPTEGAALADPAAAGSDPSLAAQSALRVQVKDSVLLDYVRARWEASASCARASSSRAGVECSTCSLAVATAGLRCGEGAALISSGRLILLKHASTLAGEWSNSANDILNCAFPRAVTAPKSAATCSNVATVALGRYCSM